MKFITLINQLGEMKYLREQFEEKYGYIDAHIHFSGNAISYYDKLMRAANSIGSVGEGIENPFAFLRNECDKITDLKMRIMESLNWPTSGILGDNKVMNSKNELLFVVNFVDEKLQKLNFKTDVIHPNNPLLVTAILLKPQGTTACSYLARIEPLDERFISIISPDEYKESTRKYKKTHSESYGYDYNLDFLGDVFDYQGKLWTMRDKIEGKQEMPKVTNLKKKIRKSMGAAPLGDKAVEIRVGHDGGNYTLFNNETYHKGDIIVVASFEDADELIGLSPNEILNPCKTRGMRGIEEFIMDGVVHTTAKVRVNHIFLNNGNIKTVRSEYKIRV